MTKKQQQSFYFNFPHFTVYLNYWSHFFQRWDTQPDTSNNYPNAQENLVYGVIGAVGQTGYLLSSEDDISPQLLQSLKIYSIYVMYAKLEP